MVEDADGLPVEELALLGIVPDADHANLPEFRERAHQVEDHAALGGREEYFTDSVHYTRAGIERLAENYADALLAAGIPPR